MTPILSSCKDAHDKIILYEDNIILNSVAENKKLLQASKKMYRTWTAFLFKRFKKHTAKIKWMQEAKAYVL